MSKPCPACGGKGFEWANGYDDTEQECESCLGTGQEQWRTLHQVLPLTVYDRLIVCVAMVGKNNGIPVKDFLDDDKNRQEVGPRVSCWERLVQTLEDIAHEAPEYLKHI